MLIDKDFKSLQKTTFHFEIIFAVVILAAIILTQVYLAYFGEHNMRMVITVNINDDLKISDVDTIEDDLRESIKEGLWSISRNTVEEVEAGVSINMETE